MPNNQVKWIDGLVELNTPQNKNKKKAIAFSDKIIKAKQTRGGIFNEINLPKIIKNKIIDWIKGEYRHSFTNCNKTKTTKFKRNFCFGRIFPKQIRERDLIIERNTLCITHQSVSWLSQKRQSASQPASQRASQPASQQTSRQAATTNSKAAAAKFLVKIIVKWKCSV